MNNTPVVRMEHIVKTFPGVVALKDVTFEVAAGTVHALVGENGAGKSTLMKVLNGQYQPDSGKIIINGKEQKISGTKESINLGIAMIHQELNPVPELTVANNLFLGREPKNKFGMLDEKKMLQMAQKLMKEFDLDYDIRAKMKTLSVAKMQMIEIIKALSLNAKVIVMDEPSSSITNKEVEKLFSFIEDIKAKGVAIIYISHRMEEIERIADYVTVLRDGETVVTKPKSELDESKIVKLMVGRDVSSYYPWAARELGEPLLEVKNLTKAGVYDDVSFTLRKGEILGVSGLIGAGRSEVMLSIFGLMQFDSGEILIDGKPLKVKRVRDAISSGIALVPENRKEQGLVLIRSISENMMLPFLKNYRSWNLNMKKLKEDEAKQMKRFAVKAPSASQLAVNLSGGNQQKVVLAKWLLETPKVLILDEPTRGIDVGAKHEIYQYITELANAGISIILVSSELPEVMGMSDRVLVMSGGRIIGVLDRADATSEKIMNMAMEEVK